MEDENGNITFAATGSTFNNQELLLETQKRKYSLPHHRKHNDLKGGFAPEFRAKISSMRELIEANINRETIKTDTDKENEL